MWWIALIQAGMQVASNVIGTQGAAGAADANARMSQSAAADALQQGAFQAGKLRAQSSQMLGEQKAGYAASGVDVTQGTPLQTMAGTRFLSDLDVQTAHNNAARRALGYQVQAQQYRDQADWDRGWGMVFGVLSPAVSGAGQALGAYGNEQARKAQTTPNVADVTPPPSTTPRRKLPATAGAGDLPTYGGYA